MSYDSCAQQTGIAGSREALVAIVRYDVDTSLTLLETLVDRMGPPFAIMERDGLELWVSGPGTSARRALADGSVPQPGGWNRLVIEVDDLDAMVDQLTAPGARLRSKPISGPGGRQVLVEDPSGNPIELFESR